MMGWLTFLNGGVVIIEASSLIHARSLAAAHWLGRVAHFAEGHFINPESAALIPDAFIGAHHSTLRGGGAASTTSGRRVTGILNSTNSWSIGSSEYGGYSCSLLLKFMLRV